MKCTVKNRVALACALKIMGNRKVLTADQAAKAWNQPVPQNVPIRYSEATLRECAEQNRSAGTDWRLVYVFGLSFREQRQMKGIDIKRQPCFYGLDWNDWWLKKEEDEWATPKPEPGYYLIDFNGRWGETSWNDQETEIRKLGSDYERTHEAVVSESILSIYQTTQERLLENWYHWGRNLDSCGLRVSVGGFVHVGLSVRGFRPGWAGGGWLRVCVSRKFPSI